MNFYLSSYKLGHKTEKLLSLAPDHRRIAFIGNAMDFVGVDPERLKAETAAEIGELEALGFFVEPLDLQDYFGKTTQLAAKLDELGSVWVRGGNVFVLRQAMRLSGFDNVIQKLSSKPNFLYAGYSAGCCVLS